jgi:hypothetical protein
MAAYGVDDSSSRNSPRGDRERAGAAGETSATVADARPAVGHVRSTAHAPAIPAGIEAVLEWHVESSRDAHGIAVWPAVELAEGLVIGNEPGTFVAADGYAYFPWPAPVTLAAGDGIAVTLRAEPLATGWESCLWNWSTTVTGVGLPAPGGRRFVQSNFLGSLDLIATAAGLSAAVARAENK